MISMNVGFPEKAGSAWRLSETKYWLNLARKDAEKNVTTIIYGFLKPKDFGDAIDDVGSTIKCILLDASPDTIRARLKQRYTRNGVYDPNEKILGKTVQEFIDGNIYIRDQLKKDFERLHCPVIDTSNLTPAEVAKRILDEIS